MMLFETIVVFGVLILLMLVGIPIAISLGMTGVFTLVVFGTPQTLQMLPQRLFAGSDSFPLLAIPFFLVAGELMLQGGISRRLVNMAKVFLYGLRGSLALIAFVASAFFGALSGSPMATTAAIGKIMYPEMLKDGTYDKDFALSVQAVGGTLGPMIPPSITLIIFGTISNASIGDMMIGTLVPGLILCLIYCITGYILIKRSNMGTGSVKPEKGILASFLDGIWALITPIIILGGIYSGVFSPTESAAAACLYALLVGIFIYKELTPSKIYNALLSAFRGYATIMFLIACASFFGWALTMRGIPQYITSSLMTAVTSQFVFLILINLVFIFLGCFIDVITLVILVVPLVAPVAVNLGIDLVHFGVLTNIVTGIGLITPPFGANLFVASSLDKSIKLESIYRRILPFCLAGIIGGLLITFVPALTLWFR